MIQKKVKLSKIRYNTVNVDQDLIDSIRKRNIAIAVKVRCDDDHYECIDGHKRCSALAILAKEDAKFNDVSVTICNDFSKAGSAYWGNTNNKH